MRRIARHLVDAAKLLPGQFPNDLDSPSNWTRLLRATIGDELLAASFSISSAVAAPTNTITVASANVASFLAGMRVRVAGTASNDGDYEIARPVQSGANVILTLADDVPATSGSGGTATVIDATGLQRLEEQVFMLRRGRTFAGATGEMLDRIGRALRLSRTSADDEVYRNDLEVQALVNASDGAPDEIISIALKTSGLVDLHFSEVYPAGMALLFIGVTPSVFMRAALRQAKIGGVRLDITVSQSARPFACGADGDGAGGFIGSLHPFGGGFGDAWIIVAASTSLKRFDITGNSSAVWAAGDAIKVLGSTANDGPYTVASAVYSAPNTRVTVNEAVPSNTGDGHLYMVQEAAPEAYPDPGKMADAGF